MVHNVAALKFSEMLFLVLHLTLVGLFFAVLCFNSKISSSQSNINNVKINMFTVLLTCSMHQIIKFENLL